MWTERITWGLMGFGFVVLRAITFFGVVLGRLLITFGTCEAARAFWAVWVEPGWEGECRSCVRRSFLGRFASICIDIRGGNNARAVTLFLSFYSFRKTSTGLASAALMAWVLMVMQAMVSPRSPPNANARKLSSMR